MIRRTKAILKLPSREDHIIKLSFDYHEKEYYRQIERPVAEMLNQASDETSQGTLWLNVIQQINKLRLVCNLGTFVPLRRSGSIQSGSDRTLAVLAARLSMGGETCGQCLQSVDSSPPGTELEGSASSTIYYSACYRLFCANCSILSRYLAPEPCACMDQPTSCPLRPLLPLLPTPRLTSTGDTSLPCMGTDEGVQISSKVRAVVSQIKTHSKEKR